MTVTSQATLHQPFFMVTSATAKKSSRVAFVQVMITRRLRSELLLFDSASILSEHNKVKMRAGLRFAQRTYL